MSVQVDGYDREGRRIWTRRFERRLPDAWLRDQVVDVSVEVPPRRVPDTARVEVHVAQPWFGLEHRHTIAPSDRAARTAAE
jgi:hypothetical protein